MVLVYTLVALVVILIAGAGLIRALDNGLMQAGNLAYQRDLTNQAQRAITAATNALTQTTGALYKEEDRNAKVAAANYFASRLASNNQGIPELLLDDADFTAAALTAGDITDAATGVTLRYVIDRQCDGDGDYTLKSCILHSSDSETSADALYKKIDGEGRPIYRISVRATGPRNSLAFFQATVAR